MFNTKIFILICFSILIFCFRVYSQGGIHRESGGIKLETGANLLQSVQHRLRITASILLPEPHAGLLLGIVLGIKEDLPSAFRTALRNTSTLHIVVASGQNLTILAGFVMSLSAFVGRRKTIAASMVVVGVYAVLTGLQIPVIRAAIMLYFTSLAKLLNREADSTWILFLTVMIMLIYNPDWLLSISFQLSVLATIGVLILAPEVVKSLTFIPDILKEDLAISFCAQLLTLPIIAGNFHQLSLVGIIVNSLVLWTIPIIMVTGTISLVFALINILLGKIIIVFTSILLDYFVAIILLFDSKWSSIYISNISMIFWIGYYIFIAGMYFYLKKINLNTLKRLDN